MRHLLKSYMQFNITTTTINNKQFYTKKNVVNIYMQRYAMHFVFILLCNQIKKKRIHKKKMLYNSRGILLNDCLELFNIVNCNVKSKTRT